MGVTGSCTILAMVSWAYTYDQIQQIIYCRCDSLLNVNQITIKLRKSHSPLMRPSLPMKSDSHPEGMSSSASLPLHASGLSYSCHLANTSLSLRVVRALSSQSW